MIRALAPATVESERNLNNLRATGLKPDLVPCLYGTTKSRAHTHTHKAKACALCRKIAHDYVRGQFNPAHITELRSQRDDGGDSSDGGDGDGDNTAVHKQRP
jgi:hypothetical protein